MGNLLVDHLEALYSTTNPSRSSDITDLFPLVVSDSDNFSLCKQPDDREIRDVVKQLGASKALESDDMTASFFQKFWRVFLSL